MAGRKLVRDLHLYRQPLFYQLTSHPQVSTVRVRLISANGYLGNRRFSVFNEFSKQVKEATNNPEFQQSVKELKEKAEEFKVVKEELKVRTKQTTEQLYKQVDGAWTEAEAAAKKVSSNVKEKISAATEEVKGTFGIGNEQTPGTSGGKSEHVANAEDGVKASSGEYKHQQSGSGEHKNQQSGSGEHKNQQSGSSSTEETLFGKFRSSIPSFSSAISRVKEAKFVDLAKKGYGILKDELNGNPTKRKHMEFDPSTVPKVETSTRTEISIVPQSRWSKKWEAFRMKMQGHPVFKRIDELRKPVTTKTQEIAEDLREHWETSDSAIVHKIQDINETIFQETDTAASIKEICRRDPSFSLPDFVAEIQDNVKPVLHAYMKADIEKLKKYCSTEVMERCKAEHEAFQNHGIFFDHKILHISEVEVKETKMMGDTPIIIVMFRTQQVYCVRDKNGEVTDGSTDTIHTVYYAWAMQPVDPEELGEGATFPIWRVREMQQFGVQTLI